MVTITKRQGTEGFFYEIDDFDSYVAALKEKGIETPAASYRILVRYEDEPLIRAGIGDLESQIAIFFKLSPATGIAYRISGG